MEPGRRGVIIRCAGGGGVIPMCCHSILDTGKCYRTRVLGHDGLQLGIYLPGYTRDNFVSYHRGVYECVGIAVEAFVAIASSLFHNLGFIRPQTIQQGKGYSRSNSLLLGVEVQPRLSVEVVSAV